MNLPCIFRVYPYRCGGCVNCIEHYTRAPLYVPDPPPSPSAVSGGVGVPGQDTP